MSVVVYSTSNDGYIPKCVVSLLSVKRYHPEYDYCIITTRPCEKHIELCKKFNILIIDIDLKEIFYKEWKYPRECYYHFKGPDLFYDRGYDYSVYIDGDIYCNNKLSVAWHKIFHIAGVSYNTSHNILDKLVGMSIIKEKFDTKLSDFTKKHVQTGFLIYNNKGLQKFNFFTKISELYDLSIKRGIPRKGDDSLLAFTIGYYKQLHVKYLSKKYNMILPLKTPYYTGCSSLITSCVICHLVKKPWDIYEKYPGYTYKYFIQKWREIMIDSFTQLEIKEYFPMFYKDAPSEIKYYWYEGNVPNFGDLITPYMVKKICGKKVYSTNPSKTKDKVLLSTGSIMRLCRDNTVVWGSGIRDIDQNIKSGNIRSVRGPLTRKRLIEIRCECPPIYGDPGLLLPMLYHPTIEKKHRLGIVPHHSQYTKVYHMYKNDALVINLETSNIEHVIDQILSCRNIASSSLHGIVVSDGNNIPVVWIKFDKLCGDDTKFYDHYMSVGIDTSDICIPAMSYKKIPVKTILDKIVPHHISFDKDRLISAGPFDFDKKILKKSFKYMFIPPYQ